MFYIMPTIFLYCIPHYRTTCITISITPSFIYFLFSNTYVFFVVWKNMTINSKIIHFYHLPFFLKISTFYQNPFLYLILNLVNYIDFLILYFGYVMLNRMLLEFYILLVSRKFD